MPRGVVYHERAQIVKIVYPVHNLVCLFGHLFVNVLACLVVKVYSVSPFHGCVVFAFRKQSHCFFSVHHTSRGVYARTDFEHNIVHCKLFAFETAQLNYGFHAH